MRGRKRRRIVAKLMTQEQIKRLMVLQAKMEKLKEEALSITYHPGAFYDISACSTKIKMVKLDVMSLEQEKKTRRLWR